MIIDPSYGYTAQYFTATQEVRVAGNLSGYYALVVFCRHLQPVVPHHLARAKASSAPRHPHVGPNLELRVRESTVERRGLLAASEQD